MLFENKQIFVVDDDESVCRALKILLMTFGFEVKRLIRQKVFLASCPMMNPVA